MSYPVKTLVLPLMGQDKTFSPVLSCPAEQDKIPERPHRPVSFLALLLMYREYLMILFLIRYLSESPWMCSIIYNSRIIIRIVDITCIYYRDSAYLTYFSQKWLDLHKEYHKTDFRISTRKYIFQNSLY